MNYLNNMNKKFLIIIPLIFLLMGCYEDQKTIYFTNTPTVVIGKTINHGRYGDSFQIKVFDGNDVQWLYIDEENYKIINVKDTLTNFIIK